MLTTVLDSAPELSGHGATLVRRAESVEFCLSSRNFFDWCASNHIWAQSGSWGSCNCLTRTLTVRLVLDGNYGHSGLSLPRVTHGVFWLCYFSQQMKLGLWLACMSCYLLCELYQSENKKQQNYWFTFQTLLLFVPPSYDFWLNKWIRFCLRPNDSLCFDILPIGLSNTKIWMPRSSKLATKKSTLCLLEETALHWHCLVYFSGVSKFLIKNLI